MHTSEHACEHEHESESAAAARAGGSRGDDERIGGATIGAGRGGSNSLKGAGTGAEAAAADGTIGGDPADAGRAKVLTVQDWDEADPPGATIKKIFRAPGSSSSQHHSSGSHGIRYPRPDAAQRLASDGDGDGDRGSDRAQPLATGGGGDRGRDGGRGRGR